VAFEDLRYLYRDAFVRAIRDLRPALSVRSASLDELDHELGRFEPHVVVSSQPSDTHPAGCGAWVQIPTDDTKEDDERLARICLDGEHWKIDGPPLSELLAVLDETHERLARGDLVRGLLNYTAGNVGKGMRRWPAGIGGAQGLRGMPASTFRKKAAAGECERHPLTDGTHTYYVYDLLDWFLSR
jgi:hypothetical protein